MTYYEIIKSKRSVWPRDTLRILLLCCRSGRYLSGAEEDTLSRLCDLNEMEYFINFASHYSFYTRPLFIKIRREIRLCLWRTVNSSSD